MNIPGIRTAFILASTTNPKEYIQRRGRVLRIAPNKPFAAIFDFVTLPRPLDTVSGLTTEQAQRDLSLVKNELSRIKEFGRLAENSMLANDLIWEIQDKQYRFRGRHAVRVDKLTGVFDTNSKAKLFERNVDVYANAPLIGFLYGRTADIDDEKNPETNQVYNQNVMGDRVIYSQEELTFNFRIIMLLDI